MMKFEQPAPPPVFKPGEAGNRALPFYPADFDPGNGAGLYVSPEFDRGVDIEPWQDVNDDLPLPPWFNLSPEFKPNAGNYAGTAPGDDGRATRYIEGVSFYPNTEENPLWDGWCYQIGRIYVPKGCFGVLYRMDCHLVAATEQGIETFNTPVDPWKFVRTFHVPLHYFLRLERPRINMIPPSGIYPGTHSNLPGVAHPDLGGWNDSRYSWGNNNYPLRLMIPEDNFCTLYCCLDTFDPMFFERPSRSKILAEIGGRLIALVSNYKDNERANDIARRGW